MTQVDFAKKGKITAEIRSVAKDEGLDAGYIKKGLADGTIVITRNSARKAPPGFRVTGIGRNLRTKVNANIGTSPEFASIKAELRKLDVAVKAGADTVMDLSTGGNLRKIRKEIIASSAVPVGTVPIYQVICDYVSKGRDVKDVDPQYIFEIIEQQCSDGVDFITVHCGITRKSINSLKKRKRVCGIVSRGGAFLTEWVVLNNRENPLYERFDKLLEIASRYDVTLSLGDGLRPGAIADASDPGQMGELRVLGGLVLEARKKNVQVMVEGPGHMPLDQVEPHVKAAKKIMHGAPYYVLGPLVTDIAPGFDHITSAIGGAVAAGCGVDFLCYVTPAEHLRLPDAKDVYNGVMASRIAAHAGDIAKKIKGAEGLDRVFSAARKKLDWKKQEKLALDPVKFRDERKKLLPKDKKVCTMCGKYCAMREADKYL